MPLPERLTGGCQCGACRYEISAPPIVGYLCHCLECQRHTTSAFSAGILVAADALSASGPIASWLREDGENPLLEAQLCSTCGVRLFHQSVPRGPFVRVKLGTLDDTSWFRPAAEFFTKRRLDWVSVDGKPVQCVEKAEDHGAVMEAWQRLYPPGG